MHCKGNDEKNEKVCGYLGNYTVTYIKVFAWEQRVILCMPGGIRAQGNAHLPVTRKLLDTNGEYEAWEWPVLWGNRLGSCDMYLKEWCSRSTNSLKEHWFLVLVFSVMECFLKIRHFFIFVCDFPWMKRLFSTTCMSILNDNLILSTREVVINRYTCIKKGMK